MQQYQPWAHDDRMGSEVPRCENQGYDREGSVKESGKRRRRRGSGEIDGYEQEHDGPECGCGLWYSNIESLWRRFLYFNSECKGGLHCIL